MLVEAGEENAGLVDIGDGLACAFKIESHNHPSAVEPYQGAATGVGGINRDIFTWVLVQSLSSTHCFGKPTEDRKKVGKRREQLLAITETASVSLSWAAGVL